MIRPIRIAEVKQIGDERVGLQRRPHGIGQIRAGFYHYRLAAGRGDVESILICPRAEAARAQRLLTGVGLFLSGLLNTAEQLTAVQRWERIWERILRPWLRPAGLISGPSG